MTTLFSIITVTYNAADTLQRTIESVKSQSCQLYEHIIMDGASTDSTMEIAHNLCHDRMSIYSEKDRGIYDAMNKAIVKSKGDYLIFLNAGDKFHSTDTLQLLADSILSNDYPGIVYGQTDIVDKDGNYLGPRHLTAPTELTLDSFKHGMVVCHQAFVALKQLVNFYNTNYKYSADYAWCIMCLQKSKRNVYVPATIIDYLSEGQTTRHHRASLKERFKIMCTYYGTWPTIIRHIKFALRYAKRRKNAANSQ